MDALTLRWAWRDLKARWIQVVVIALVVALGTGMYAGLMSTSEWARISYDESYALSNMHDVRVQLAAGSFAPSGTLRAAVEELGDVTVAEERLFVPVQFDASTTDQTIIVRGMLIGAATDARVDRVSILAGRALEPGDTGAPVTVLERNFGLFYDLPPRGSITLGGGERLTYVGQGVAPEYFIVQPPEGGFFSQADYGVVFTSLETAQQVSGLDAVVNDLVIDGEEDQDVLASRVRQVFESRFPQLGATITTGAQDPTLRLLYDDLEGDRQFFWVFAALIFAGAIAAAFNLTSRMVEAIRREFGIAMALGVERRRIAIRPLLVAAHIAALGVAFGLGIGLLVNQAMRGVFLDLVPLPVFLTPFLPGQFLGGAVIGFLAPFVAAAIPVWRALRVEPVDAIRTGHLASRGGGRAHLLRFVPGDSFFKIPFRNLVRAPRRTVLTAFGIGASVTVLVGMVVMVDSFLATIDKGAAEVTAGAPDRIVVGFDTFHPADGPEVMAVLDAASVGRADEGLRVPSTVREDEVELDVLLEVVDLESTLWHPSFVAGGPSDQPGLVLAEKAATDLGVGVGDQVVLRHPRREGLFSFALVDSVLPVTGIHPHPFRFVAYLDDEFAGLLGMDGLVNSMSIEPAPGYDLTAVQRELFENRAVASVQGAGAIAEIIRDFLEQFIGILEVAEVGAIAIMFLIAFNSAAVAFDERARDHATMMAFGVRRRRILRMAVVESGLLGLISSVIGSIGGVGFLRWAVRTNVEETTPDIQLDYVFTPSLVALVVGLGIAAVALAPLLTFRKLRKLDVPSTLRVME